MFKFILALAILVAVEAFIPFFQPSTNSMTASLSHPSIARNRERILKRNMFSGAGGGSEEEAEKQAKAMGMDLKEYQLAMKMREQFAARLGAAISVGTSPGVTVTYDGNIRPLSAEITDEGIALGAERLSAGIVEAMNSAMGKAQKTMQMEMQEMQKNIAKELS